MSLRPYSILKKLLWGGALLMAALCTMLLVPHRHGRLEPLVRDCPIRWASASYGTDLRFHTWHGRPLGCPTLGNLLVRIEMALASRNRGRSVLGVEGTFLDNRSAEPILLVRVVVPPQTNLPPRCYYRITVANERGVIGVSTGCGCSRTVEEYQFRGLPITSEKGLVVEFYRFELENFSSFPTNSATPAIARLRL